MLLSEISQKTHTSAPHSGQPRATRTRRRSESLDARREHHQAVSGHPEAVGADVDRPPSAVAVERPLPAPAQQAGARSCVVHTSGVPAEMAAKRVRTLYLRALANLFTGESPAC